jgi:hypothetical protein
VTWVAALHTAECWHVKARALAGSGREFFRLCCAHELLFLAVPQAKVAALYDTCRLVSTRLQ